MTVHVYTISPIDASELWHEVEDDPGIAPSLIGINIAGTSATMTFDVALSVPAEKSALDAVVAAHTGTAPEESSTDAAIAVAIASTEQTVSNTNWVTVGTVVLAMNRYGDRSQLRVEALGMAKTTSGAADVRIAWANEDGGGAFGVTTIQSDGTWAVVSHNRAPANIPGKPTEYRLQFRNGASLGLDVRGWVLSFITK
jgi:hypothetical protein